MTFRATLRAMGRGGHSIALTPAQAKALDGKPHARVKGTINGAPLRTTMFPYGGVYYLLLHKATVQAAGLAPGAKATLTLRRDTAPRRLAVPADLRRALARNAKAKANFDALAFTHRKEYASWVADAKRPETRARRIAETVELCAANTTWEDR